MNIYNIHVGKSRNKSETMLPYKIVLNSRIIGVRSHKNERVSLLMSEIHV